jgi:hypothetical protein
MMYKQAYTKTDTDINDREIGNFNNSKNELMNFEQWNIPQLLDPDDLEPKEMANLNIKGMSSEQASSRKGNLPFKLKKRDIILKNISPK